MVSERSRAGCCVLVSGSGSVLVVVVVLELKLKLQSQSHETMDERESGGGRGRRRRRCIFSPCFFFWGDLYEFEMASEKFGSGKGTISTSNTREISKV